MTANQEHRVMPMPTVSADRRLLEPAALRVVSGEAKLTISTVSD
jgi:hypothetical protein